MNELDLRGEVCPYTYVRTKLALEDLQAGESLVVWLDAPSARDNVPRSARQEGHEVVSVSEPEPGLFRVEVRCGTLP